MTLTIEENDVLYVFVDMLYPYGMQRNEEAVAKYGGLVRKTLVDKDSLCWTWMGFGYSMKELSYCNINEHIMPRIPVKRVSDVVKGGELYLIL